MSAENLPPAASPGPKLSPQSVFFVGNGILRVPCRIVAEQGAPAQPRQGGAIGPSWLTYMETLWGLVEKSHGAAHAGYDRLQRADFARLSAPRQAEWFDRTYQVADGGAGGLRREDLPVLRLHELGRTLHASPGRLTNPLLEELAALAVAGGEQAGSNGQRATVIDVLTTNLDCSLEQNLAAALDKARPGESASIEVIVDFRTSVVWRRGPGEGSCKVRLWKLHGCLRDLAERVPEDQRQRVLRALGDQVGQFCGHVPLRDCLVPGDPLSGWAASDQGSAPAAAQHCGVFSQSEYFANIRTLIELEAARDGEASLSTTPRARSFAVCFEILKQRELLLVGYSLPDVDVDILYLLQKSAAEGSGAARWRLMPEKDRSKPEGERLNQLGVRPWCFGLSALARCPEPGRMQEADAHEWRVANEGLARAPALRAQATEAWRKQLSEVAAQAWLLPQWNALRRLAPARAEAGLGASVDDYVEPPAERLVVAGLGSIWHAFSLQSNADFPRERRTSAQVSSVDEQVPGGSGLVPVMVAAALAGPEAAGEMVFLSNVPKAWKSWGEIEEFCLSAGVDVRPLQGDAAQIARTSHVLLYQEGESSDGAKRKGDGAPVLARQRFILDVQSYVVRDKAEQTLDKVPRVPGAQIPSDFQAQGRRDLLFADKEADWQSIRRWRGPTILETGSTGDELLPVRGRGCTMPTIWTSGIGSFVRTLVELERRDPGYKKRERPESTAVVLEEMRERANLRPLLDGCDSNCASYVARLVSFQTPAGALPKGSKESLDDMAELEYGRWLQKKWTELAPHLRAMLEPFLGSLDPALGRGILTTCHAGGMMALWDYPDGSTEDIVVKIDDPSVVEDSISYRLACTVAGVEERRLPSASIEVSADKRLHLRWSDGGATEEIDLGVSTPYRRNTLGAGDTVRGALCYGLWAAGFHPERALEYGTLPTLLMASAVLATLKCYAGSFVDFLRLTQTMRMSPVWGRMWPHVAHEAAREENP